MPLRRYQWLSVICILLLLLIACSDEEASEAEIIEQETGEVEDTALETEEVVEVEEPELEVAEDVFKNRSSGMTFRTPV